MELERCLVAKVLKMLDGMNDMKLRMARPSLYVESHCRPDDALTLNRGLVPKARSGTPTQARPMNQRTLRWMMSKKC
jgi:hypothetical protein